MSIADNLARIRTQIQEAASLVGRDPNGITLIAVSKIRPPEDIREAMAAGHRDFGENYAQELRAKVDAIGLGGDLKNPPRWHFIGALQRNKVKYVVGRAQWVHDVDNPALAEEISKRSLPRRTPILLGVNIGREPQKSGWMPEQVLEVAPKIMELPGVEVRGLMCIPPAQEDPEASAPYFAELADLAARGRALGLPLQELSMGMSHDFSVAIRHGATMVRVGTAIFGARPPKN